MFGALLELSEWACELDKDLKRINISYKGKPIGHYGLIAGLKTFCKKCMHPFTNEVECFGHFPDEQLDRTLAVDVYYRKSIGYANLMTNHILALKNNREIAKPLSLAMIECFKKEIFPNFELKEIDYIAPVPKHPDELKVDASTSEKYNQAELLAAYLAKGLKLQLLHALEKSKPLSLQGKGRDERRMLAKEAYCINQEMISKLKTKKVLLIDDLRASGSTGDACSSVLKHIGVEKVLLCVAGRDVIQEVAEKCITLM